LAFFLSFFLFGINYINILLPGRDQVGANKIFCEFSIPLFFGHE
jgi:hypothetical protein